VWKKTIQRQKQRIRKASEHITRWWWDPNGITLAGEKFQVGGVIRGRDSRLERRA